MRNSKPNYLEPKETDRLILLPVTEEYIKPWEEWIMDPIATKHFPDWIKGAPEKSKVWIDRILDRYQKEEFGFFAIHLKENNTFLGFCGLLSHEIDGEDEVEVGYSFLRKHWGNGYATEAARFFMDHGFKEYDLGSIISLIVPENKNSSAVALLNGLENTGHVLHHEIGTDVYRITREKFFSPSK